LRTQHPHHPDNAGPTAWRTGFPRGEAANRGHPRPVTPKSAPVLALSLPDQREGLSLPGAVLADSVLGLATLCISSDHHPRTPLPDPTVILIKQKQKERNRKSKRKSKSRRRPRVSRVSSSLSLPLLPPLFLSFSLSGCLSHEASRPHRPRRIRGRHRSQTVTQRKWWGINWEKRLGRARAGGLSSGDASQIPGMSSLSRSSRRPTWATLEMLRGRWVFTSGSGTPTSSVSTTPLRDNTSPTSSWSTPPPGTSSPSYVPILLFLILILLLILMLLAHLIHLSLSIACYLLLLLLPAMTSPQCRG